MRAAAALAMEVDDDGKKPVENPKQKTKKKAASSLVHHGQGDGRRL